MSTSQQIAANNFSTSINHISNPNLHQVSPNQKFSLFLLAKGVLAQLVQSACLTGMRSLVRFQYIPQKKREPVIDWLPFFILVCLDLSYYIKLPAAKRSSGILKNTANISSLLLRNHESGFRLLFRITDPSCWEYALICWGAILFPS